MVNSLSTYNRISGLASGLDTESLIKGLTSTQRSRITKAEQEKQTLLWKREFYRDIMNQMNTFKNKYFGSSNPLSNLKLYTATNSASQYVSVSPGADAKEGTVVINDIISLASASKYESSSPISKQVTIDVDLAKTANLSGKAMSVTVGGTVRTITFSAQDYSSVDSVKNELQFQLNKAFGENTVTVAVQDNTLTLTSEGNSVKLSKTGVEGSEAYDVLGFTDGLTNRISTVAPLSTATFQTPVSSASGTLKFTINGKPFQFSTNAALSDIVKAVNASDAGVTMNYSSITDKITLTSKETGTGVGITVADTEGNLMSSLFGAGSYTEGTNAQFKISTSSASDPDNVTYSTITKSSNSFTLDGVTYTLLSKAAGTAAENISINVKYDVDKVYDTIKSFVTDYNTMLKAVTDKLNETKYKDFAPLTDDQKEKLTDKEQETWTEKAKSGLLRGDMELTSIASDLRKALYSTVYKIGSSTTSVGVVLPEIGITTGLYSDRGQLKIDEAKLKNALAEKPDEIIALFTQKSKISYSRYLTDDLKKTRYNESGIFDKISDIINNNISYGGRLYELIGSTDSDYSSIYGKKISTIERKIDDLNDKLTEQEKRYWTKFSQMESALTKLNSTGSWLSSQLS